MDLYVSVKSWCVQTTCALLYILLTWLKIPGFKDVDEKLIDVRFVLSFDNIHSYKCHLAETS